MKRWWFWSWSSWRGEETRELEPVIIHDSDSGDGEGGDQQGQSDGTQSESMIFLKPKIQSNVIEVREEENKKEIDVIFYWTSIEEEMDVETVEEIRNN